MALVRFSVKNYLSFKCEQTLSLEAGRQGTGKNGRSFSTKLKPAPNLLHGAVIYGANSGGKSNLIAAMATMRRFVMHSASGQKGDPIPVSPYRLDTKCREEPSEFEIIFIHKDVLYQYGFSADAEKVHGEWLYETPSDGRIRHIFSRDLDTSSGDYEWYVNSRIRGEKKVWQESTRSNSLFLSTANQLNSQDLEPPFEWLNSHFRVFSSARSLGDVRTSQYCLDEEKKGKVVDLIRSVDPEIEDLRVKESEFDAEELLKDFSEQVRESILSELKGKKHYDASLIRSGTDGMPIEFALEEESTGNSIMYSLAGPWIDTLESGYTLIIDELDSGLHPLALRALVSLFFSKSHNTSNAQLVITCHEATLLQDNLLRTDQIWFLDRNINAGSVLYPLSDFKPRQNESFLRGYLGGRYRGIPLARTSR
ncbi:AAA family ATPase [Erythrobacter aquimaris]|uniref:AAA family ATPase n=1 Tax=Qipengyuania aquimaris TaxID=255984 RepID=A0A6I4TLI2_9SPHN|nr:ATP-binding protein [Qipengyuania aquimaris]MXO95901.1 AAA family ATPase [Qipengyuania aquimaris]